MLNRKTLGRGLRKMCSKTKFGWGGGGGGRVLYNDMVINEVFWATATCLCVFLFGRFHFHLPKQLNFHVTVVAQFVVQFEN